MLVEEVEDGIIGLLVGGDGDNRRVVVGHRLRLPLRRIDRRGDVGEHPLDGPLHGIHVHVAHDDEGLQIRAVPFLVIRPQLVGLEVLDHVDRADGHPVGVAASGEHLRQLLLPHAGLRVLPGAPFLAYHAPFLADGGVGQRQAPRPVVQDEQARVHHAALVHRRVGNHVHRLVERGIGVEVLAAAHPHALDVLVHAVVREIPASVEGHMLQEVRQPALVLLLQDGAHVLGDVEIRPVLGQLVMTDVIRQSVAQPSVPHGGIDRERLRFWLSLRHHLREGYQAKQERRENRFSLYHSRV